MMLSRRKLLHFNIKGKEERILPVLVCLQEEDLSYMNNNIAQVLSEIQDTILDNLAEMEKKANSDCKSGLGLGYVLLPAGELISAAYCASIRNESSSYQSLQYNHGSVSAPPVAKFFVTLWICPADKSHLLHSLASD
jgi:hypothetical protein